MLINGEQVEGNVFKKLENIPSSFPEYISNLTPKPLSPKELDTQRYAANFYNIGVELFKTGNHTAAIKQLKQAEQIAVNQTDNNFLSCINTTMARSYQTIGDFDNAIQKFQDSINNTFETKRYYDTENLYKELVTAHQQQGTLKNFIDAQESNLMKSQSENDASNELMARLALGAAYKAQSRKENSIEQYAHAYSLQQGKIDYDAVRVEQHEVGFSNKEKIGTDNIQQCVAVILHDPLTKKTALAHVDRFTDASSLTNDVISNFPPNTKLEAYLVGGRDRSPNSIAVSDGNISKVMQELGKHSNVNIKAADIGNKGAPSGIVFDPLTAKLEHAVPGKEDRTTATRQACLGIGGNTPTLYKAFDLTENKTIPNRLLNEAQKKYIMQQYLSGQAAVPNATETWQANQISKPLIKVAEEIRQTDPLLVQEVNEFLENKPARKPIMQQIKDIFTNISNKIGQFIENNIISKSQVQKIKNFFTNTSNSEDKTKNVVNDKGNKVSVKTDIKMSDGVKIARPMNTPVRENFSHTKNNSKSR